MKGKLIVIEGLDGSGKSTQWARLAKALEEKRIACRSISFPDYEDPSSMLVRMYLSGEFGSAAGDVNAYAASTFYAVDRYAAYVRHWRSDYEAGKVILAARYTTSNVLHQMSKLPREQWEDYLVWLENLEYERMGIPRPDLVLYLDMPDEASQRLLSHRYQGDESKKDLHERDAGYRQGCAAAAVYAADRLGWRVVSCAEGGEPLPVEKIGQCLLNEVYKMLGMES